MQLLITKEVFRIEKSSHKASLPYQSTYLFNSVPPDMTSTWPFLIDSSKNPVENLELSQDRVDQSVTPKLEEKLVVPNIIRKPLFIIEQCITPYD